jgi:hypothetical protein
MPFDVSGNFTRLYNWQTDRNNGIKILASRMDGEFDNFATGMNLVFFRDGRVNMAGTLGMGSNRMTGVSDGSAANPSIKFNGDTNSGPFLDGLSRWGVAVNATKRFVVSAAGIEVVGGVAAATGAFTGSVTAADITTTGKGKFDGVDLIYTGTGVVQGRFDAWGSGILYDADNHNYRTFAGAPIGELVAGQFRFGSQTGTAADTYLTMDNTNAFNNIVMRNWVAGASTTYASIGSVPGPSFGTPSLRLQGLTNGVSLGTFTNVSVLTADDNGFTLSKGVAKFTDGVGLPAPSANGYISYNTTNGLNLVGAGLNYDVALFNKSAAAKLVINTGAELELLGAPKAPTAAGGTNTQQIATTAYVMGAGFAPIANPTFTGTAQYTAAIGAGTSTVELGFRDMPPQAKTGAYPLVLADRSTLIPNTTGGWSIPANASVAFPVGSIMTLYNDSASAQNITITSDTLRLTGTTTTGTRTVAPRGLATIVKVKATEWACSGPGVS